MLLLSGSLQHTPPLLGSSQGLRSVSRPRIISLRCLSHFWGSLHMALKMLVGAWPHCNQAQLHLQEPLMPCGLSFLNRDFPPAFFFLSLSFHMVTDLAFRVRFGFLTENQERGILSRSSLLHPAPTPQPSCAKVPRKLPLLLLGFLGRSEPHWDSTPSPPPLNVLSESVQTGHWQ